MPRVDYIDDPHAPEPNSVVPSVVAVVQDAENRVLMIHKTDNDKWALPGGGHEIGGICIEVAADDGTRVLLNLGMPLVAPAGGDFPFGTPQRPTEELIADRIGQWLANKADKTVLLQDLTLLDLGNLLDADYLDQRIRHETNGELDLAAVRSLQA